MSYKTARCLTVAICIISLVLGANCQSLAYESCGNARDIDVPISTTLSEYQPASADHLWTISIPIEYTSDQPSKVDVTPTLQLKAADYPVVGGIAFFVGNTSTYKLMEADISVDGLDIIQINSFGPQCTANKLRLDQTQCLDCVYICRITAVSGETFRFNVRNVQVSNDGHVWNSGNGIWFESDPIRTDFSNDEELAAEDLDNGESAGGEDLDDAESADEDWDDTEPADEDWDDTEPADEDWDDTEPADEDWDDAEPADEDWDDAEPADEDWDDTEPADEDWDDAEPADEDWDDAESADEDWDDAESADKDWDDAESADEDWIDAESANEDWDDAEPADEDSDDKSHAESSLGDASASSSVTLGSVVMLEFSPMRSVSIQDIALALRQDIRNIKVYRGDSLVNSSLATGDIIRVRYNSKRPRLVVMGDVTGNGKTGVTDLVRVADAIANQSTAARGKLMAADFDHDGTLSLTDLVRLARLFVQS